MNYYIIGSDGNEYGPYATEQLKGYVAEGRISLATQARLADGGDWRPLSQYPEFGAAAPVAPAVAPVAAAAAPVLPSPTYSAPSYGTPAFAAPQGGGFPWEMRQTLGFMPALTESVRMLALTPKEAYARIQEKGDYLSPMLFGGLLSWVGFLASSIWQLLFGASWQTMMPAAMRSGMGGMGGAGASAAMTIGMVIIYPILYVVGLFIGAGILHLCFMIVGALTNSTSGFEGTLRVVAYAGLAQIANVVPFLGGLAAAIWGLILMVVGAQALHKTTQGKAIAAVLIPVAVCCVCIIIAVVMGAAAFMGAAGR
jgi:hypothetical protein